MRTDESFNALYGEVFANNELTGFVWCMGYCVVYSSGGVTAELECSVGDPEYTLFRFVDFFQVYQLLARAWITKFVFQGAQVDTYVKERT